MLWYKDRDSRSQGSAELGHYVTDLGNDFALPPSAQRLAVLGYQRRELGPQHGELGC